MLYFKLILKPSSILLISILFNEFISFQDLSHDIDEACRILMSIGINFIQLQLIWIQLHPFSFHAASFE